VTLEKSGSRDGMLCVLVVTLADVENIADPLQSVKPGLVSSSDVCLPLKSVHVRAKLVDLAAQVS